MKLGFRTRFTTRDAQQMPYYLQDGALEAFEKAGGPYWQIRLLNVGPPIRAGEAIAGGTKLDGTKDEAWVYLTGQRRVRKLPNPCCDTPTPAAAGVLSFDEIEVWTGRLDHFDWKIAGKKEMFIPYNGNKLMLDGLKYRVGPKLMIDAKSETFVSNQAANAMLTREYRKGFEVPAKL